MVTDAFGSWAGADVRQVAVSDQPATTTRTRSRRGQGRRAAIGAPRWPRRRAATAPGLFPDRGNERDSRRPFFVADQSEPARGARVHVRCVLVVRLAPKAAGPFTVATAVRSDVTDAAVREILLEIDKLREVGGDRRRADTRDELSRRRVPDSVRVDHGDRERAREPGVVRAA